MISFAEIRDLLAREKPKTFNALNPYYKYDASSPCKRDILVLWVTKLSSNLNHSIKTLELAVLIIDTYLNYFNISEDYLQLLGISAYSIAYKFNETEFMPLDSLQPKDQQNGKVCKPMYMDEDYNEMEVHILRAMGYQLNLITLSDFLIALNIKIDEQVSCLIQFILMDFEIYRYSHFELALAIMHYQNDTRLTFQAKILTVSQMLHNKIIQAQEIECEKSEQEETKSLERSHSIHKKISKKRESQRKRQIQQQK
ncbi:unnamed protein product (macronuclear) [Paramecium tetraurelia]|uniref:Cyclin N-terminal domain-containing protein n=1 Tax=Paramecium tetraurelia TaxID=5888 RepID=A0BWZ5_PARTE|nr:uncharacterized protein GSPATT00032914001 [Paramecium tetraurelia]CAK63062.1 unnamed protein product [Paramecium tetraurelia]|eukprot:XP_001430460.1 hypothetical protein (macronuclear) [Paramecium tetraurelia strain d4-2]